MHSHRYEKISISIPGDLASKLDKLAESEEFSRSEIVSKLIEFGLDNITDVSDLEPLMVRIDWPKRNSSHEIEMKTEDEIIFRTPKGAFRMLPWREGDFVDVVPIKSNKAFGRISLWNTTQGDGSRLGKYVGSATLVCIGLGLISRKEIDIEESYNPEK